MIETPIKMILRIHRPIAKAKGVLSILVACFLLFLSSVTPTYAQPKWVDHAIETSKTIDVHEDAAAIEVYTDIEMDISSRSRTITTYKKCYKILGRDGEGYNRLTISTAPFYSVKRLLGWLIRKDGTTYKLKKEDIYLVSADQSAGYYDDDHYHIAQLPTAEVGDYVAFEYKTEEEGWTSLYQSHVFQVQEPVKYARFSVSVPRGWELHRAEWNTSEIKYTQDGSTYEWIAENLAYQPSEPLAPSWFYLARRVAFTVYKPNKEGTHHFEDWNSISSWIYDMYEKPAKVTDRIQEMAIEIAKDSMSIEEKIKAIAAFTQNEIRYVAVEIGKGRWKPRDAHLTLYNRYGDCKDKATLMRSLLDAAGIPSVPVLASQRYPVDPRLPTPFQFDHCIVAIPLPKTVPLSSKLDNASVNKWLFFDPTDDSTPLGELPIALQGDHVLLAQMGDSTLYKLPYPDSKDYRKHYQAIVDVDEEGSLRAEVLITDKTGYAIQSRYMNKILSEEEKEEYARRLFSNRVSSLEILSYETEEYSDSLVTRISLKGSGYIQKSGSLFLLQPDLFQLGTLEELKSKKRVHPVWFGGPQELTSEIQWNLPETWKVEADTSLYEYECTSASFKLTSSIDQNKLLYQSFKKQNGRLMWLEEYKTARSFTKAFEEGRSQVAIITTIQ